MDNFFWLLLLAHLIADFPLQTDFVFRVKSQHPYGVLLHCGIVTGVTAAVCFPYLTLGAFWLVLLVKLVSHLIIDKSKLIITSKYLKDDIFFFILDQFLHITVILCIVQFYQPSYPLSDLSPLYNTSVLIILSGFIISVFGGTIWVFYMQLWVSQRSADPEQSPVAFPRMKKKLLGYFERLVMTVAFLLGNWFYLLVILTYLPRYILARDSFKNGLPIKVKVATSVLLSLVVGFALRRYIY
ncbi:DUF3307 domain-containing protein [candidate division KSB1 bacterium]|nr:DUF3307 domain-containing protein [candidate division KSB1 bacterium]